ncbi:hypothetical protein BJY00DRAFT_292028 [Aspergillus carlsbadensis]|nr:hypothetical protein BJY00DRAFT_292028 [Aspergillus carlsbadensis]
MQLDDDTADGQGRKKPERREEKHECDCHHKPVGDQDFRVVFCISAYLAGLVCGRAGVIVQERILGGRDSSR